MSKLIRIISFSPLVNIYLNRSPQEIKTHMKWGALVSDVTLEATRGGFGTEQIRLAILLSNPYQ